MNVGNTVSITVTTILKTKLALRRVNGTQFIHSDASPRVVEVQILVLKKTELATRTNNAK